MKIDYRDVDWGDAAFAFCMVSMGVLVLCFSACVARMAITGKSPFCEANTQQIEVRVK